MTQDELKNITGVGLIFPIEIEGSGKAILDYGFPLIISDLKIFLTWFLGTRYFLGNYGTNIYQILQEQNDDIARDLITFDIKERLPNWDQRLEVVDLTFTRPIENEVLVKIKIRLKGTPVEEVFKLPITTLI